MQDNDMRLKYFTATSAIRNATTEELRAGETVGMPGTIRGSCFVACCLKT